MLGIRFKYNYKELTGKMTLKSSNLPPKITVTLPFLIVGAGRGGSNQWRGHKSMVDTLSQIRSFGGVVIVWVGGDT